MWWSFPKDQLAVLDWWIERAKILSAINWGGLSHDIYIAWQVGSLEHWWRDKISAWQFKCQKSWQQLWFPRTYISHGVSSFLCNQQSCWNFWQTFGLTAYGPRNEAIETWRRCQTQFQNECLRWPQLISYEHRGTSIQRCSRRRWRHGKLISWQWRSRSQCFTRWRLALSPMQLDEI